MALFDSVPLVSELSLVKFGDTSELLGWNGKFMESIRGAADATGMGRTTYDLGLGSLIGLLTLWNAWKVYQGFRTGKVNIGNIIIAWISIGLVFGKPDSILPVILIFGTLFALAKQMQNHHGEYWGTRGEKAAARMVGRTYVGTRLNRWGRRLRKMRHWMGRTGHNLGKIGSAMVGVGQGLLKKNAEQLNMQKHVEWMENAILAGEKELSDGLQDVQSMENRSNAVSSFVAKIIQAIRTKIAEIKTKGGINTAITMWTKQIGQRILQVFEQEARLDEAAVAKQEKIVKILISILDALDDSLRLFLENVTSMRMVGEIDADVKKFFGLLKKKMKERLGKRAKAYNDAVISLSKTESEFLRVIGELRRMIHNDNIGQHVHYLRKRCATIKENLKKAEHNMAKKAGDMKKIVPELAHLKTLLETELKTGEVIKHNIPFVLRHQLYQYYDSMDRFIYALRLELTGLANFTELSNKTSVFCWDITQHLERVARAEDYLMKGFANMGKFAEEISGNPSSRAKMHTLLRIETSDNRVMRKEIWQQTRD